MHALLKELHAQGTADQLRRIGPVYPCGPGRIRFNYDGRPHVAVLRGRNVGRHIDRHLALRALIDGDATPIRDER